MPDIEHEFAYGALVCEPSEKDHKMEDKLVACAAIESSLPDAFEYDTQLPVLHQGNVNSCVAHTTKKLIEFFNRKEHKKGMEFSNNFIYHNRLPSDYQGQGMYTRQALDHLRNEGTCLYEVYPGNREYVQGISAFLTNVMFNNAKSQRVKEYVLVPVYDQKMIKRSLIENGPLILTIPVFKSFHLAWGGKDFIDHSKDDKDMRYGSHSVLVLGYRTNAKGNMELKIQNSWGTNWGKDGVAWLSDDYTRDEMWTLIDEFLPPPIEKQRSIIFTIGCNDYFVDGKKFTMDTVPIINYDARTMVPIRFVATALSCAVECKYGTGEDGGNVVHVFDYNKGNLYFPINQAYYINGDGEKIAMDTKTILDDNDRTLLPIRVVAEALGCKVDWNSKTNVIVITK